MHYQNSFISLPLAWNRSVFSFTIWQTVWWFIFNRLFRSHGATCHEVYLLRHGTIPRIPDAVVWPKNHQEVAEIVALANECGVCLIPFGGGTSVSSALECPPGELRMIVSLDMTKMNRILWIDYENMTMCAEAGIIGEDLERQVIWLKTNRASNKTTFCFVKHYFDDNKMPCFEESFNRSVLLQQETKIISFFHTCHFYQSEIRSYFDTGSLSSSKLNAFVGCPKIF